MDFVKDLIDLTKPYESPTSFWKWSAYATIAATLRHNFFVDQGLLKTQCNVYVVLVASSGQSRKDNPIRTAGRLLTAQECKATKVFQGRATTQGIVDALSKHEQRGGVTLQGGGCAIIAPELSASFVQEPSLIEHLTDLYDAKEEYDVSLKSTGRVFVKDVCITLLGGSNEQLLMKVYSGDAVYGGLLGRTLMVTPSEVRPANSLMRLEPMTLGIDDLKKTLQYVRDKIKGPAELTEGAKDLYESWYNKLYASYATAEDNTGVLQRIHMNALKVSMIIAASRGSKVVTDEIMNEAIDDMTSLRGNYTKFEMTGGKSTAANIGATFLSHLFNCKNYTDTRQGFMSVYWKDISAEDFDKLVTTLETAGLLINVVGSKPVYKLSPRAIAKFQAGTGEK